MLYAPYEESHLLVDLMTVTIIKSKWGIVKNLSALLLGFVTFLLKIIVVQFMQAYKKKKSRIERDWWNT